MEWNILVGPLIGAVIGYVTNKIAVEMLFRPINPIYIGKFHVPFTPGFIPKGKMRLGRSIGDVVGNNLLTPSIVKDTLLSDDIQHEIEKQIDLLFQNLNNDHTTIDLKIHSMLGETSQSAAALEGKIIDVLTKKLSNGLITMNLGEIIAGEVMAAVQEKVQGTMLALLLNPSVLAPMKDEIKIRINKYIEEHGEEKVNQFIQEEYKKLNRQTVSSILKNINTGELKQTILSLYRILINNNAEKLISALNLSKIVEEKIYAMDTIEMEKLVISIMKKELGAIVNLGALIGFLLGLLNLVVQ